MTNGKLRYALGDLAALPRAAVVVEDRYSAMFKQRHTRPAWAVTEPTAQARTTTTGSSLRVAPNGPSQPSPKCEPEPAGPASTSRTGGRLRPEIWDAWRTAR